MNERLVSILNATIQEFIKTGEPVSSGLLYRRHSFGIRPAQIRNQLQELTELGFLDQPYHSAGRVPSDHGYEFFVERILEDDPMNVPSTAAFQNLFRRSAWPNLLESFAETFHLFSVADDLRTEEVYRQGLDRLIENWDSPEEIRSVIHDLEHLDERMDILSDALENDGVEVFIGRKSPVTKNAELSLIAGKYEEGKKKVMLVAVGPKRMNYKNVLGVFKHFQNTK